MTHRKMTLEKKQLIIDLRAGGKRLREIAEVVDLDYTTVGKLLNNGFAGMAKYQCKNCGGPTSSELKLCKKDECQKLYAQEYYLGKRRAYYRKSVHGLTDEDFDQMYADQSGQCAICGQPKTKEEMRIDHDHASGEIRKLLCHHCNVGLGHFRDNPALLRAAADYLEGVKCPL